VAEYTYLGVATGNVLNDAHICRSGSPAGRWSCEDPLPARRAAWRAYPATRERQGNRRGKG
jgi:hypothetical protein